RLVAETEAAVMHRHQRLRFQLAERTHRFLRVHVRFARERRIVSADGQERDLDVVTFADFFKPLEVRSVAAVKNGSPIGSNDEAAKAAMRISEKARAPMMRRGKRHPQRPELNRLPFVQLM